MTDDIRNNLFLKNKILKQKLAPKLTNGKKSKILLK